MFAGRPLGRVVRALAGRQHYRALAGMIHTCPDPVDVLTRYLLGRGDYPCGVRVRTPIGPRTPRLYVHDDILTLNEIFCREDYPAGPDLGVVVDLGSNIGLSALYFLTRNTRSSCYLFEPVPANVERLRTNLLGLEDRYVLSETAVAAESGAVQFGVEPTGRYGGIGLRSAASIRVHCEHVNDVLERVLSAEGEIHVLKIDTEGQEARTIAAIAPGLLPRIGRIYAELALGQRIAPPPGFKAVQYGSTVQLYRIRR